MELGLERKNVLVTGGSRGIGLACARVFLAEGARVAIASRSPRHLEEAVQSLGRVVTAAAEELTPEAWRAAMDAKYFTYINVIDPMVKRMAARGRGVIVNVIGQGGKVASPTHLAGGAANAALMLATAGLANAYALHGVRVVGVNPGLTRTDRVSEGLRAEARRLGITEQEALQRTVARLPLGRLASPEEIADVVAFAASERGRYLTGANVSLDGAATASVV